MSEEILKALTQLFAVITKQDGGVTENERQFVNGRYLGCQWSRNSRED